MRRSKRLLSAVLALCVTIGGISVNAFAAEGDTFDIGGKTVKIGDYFQMGTYYDEPILWRCINTDENGPLMLSDKILCIKCFDAAGKNTSGSHGREVAHNDIAGYYRQNFGSNYWGDSNIRDWLNSDAAAGEVVWSCQNPPVKEALMIDTTLYETTLTPDESALIEQHNRIVRGYDQEKGFLSNFTSAEKAAIKTVTQKQLLCLNEYPLTSVPDFQRLNINISDVLQNYDTAYSEKITDKVFLLDIKQIYDVWTTFGSYYMAYPTAKLVEALPECNLNTDKYVSYWLRSPDACSNVVRVADMSGKISIISPYGYYIGIRPAFYLDTASAELTGGEGIAADPYIINGKAAADSFVYADADGDKIITASDASYILQKTLISDFELPLQAKTSDWLKYTDVDGDKAITASDASYILQKTLISTFELPVEKKNQ